MKEQARMSDSPALKDKRAVIFGAGGSIGGAVARAFAEEGAELFLAGRSKDSLEAVAQWILGFGGRAHVDVVGELAGEVGKPLEVGVVGGESERGADGPAEGQTARDNVRVECDRVVELAAEQIGARSAHFPARPPRSHSRRRQASSALPPTRAPGATVVFEK